MGLLGYDEIPEHGNPLGLLALPDIVAPPVVVTSSEELDGFIAIVDAFVYPVILASTFGGSFDTAEILLGAGLCTAALAVNGVTAATAVLTAGALTLLVPGASISVGDKVTLVTSSVTAAFNLAFTFKFTRLT